MKLWIASNCTDGTWYDVNKINPMAHGRAESGELLEYYTDDKKNLLAAYGWNSQYNKYRKHAK